MRGENPFGWRSPLEFSDQARAESDPAALDRSEKIPWCRRRLCSTSNRWSIERQDLRPFVFDDFRKNIHQLIGVMDLE
jgi:hypothetical protein